MALKIRQWNANGLVQYIPEIETFLKYYQLDLLIPEQDSLQKIILKYTTIGLIYTSLTICTDYGETAVIIRKKFQHPESDPYKQDYLQATSVMIDDYAGRLTFTAVYSLP